MRDKLLHLKLNGQVREYLEALTNRINTKLAPFSLSKTKVLELCIFNAQDKTIQELLDFAKSVGMTK